MARNHQTVANKAAQYLQLLFMFMLPLLVLAQAQARYDTPYELYRDARSTTLTWERMVGGYILLILGTHMCLRGFRYYRVTICLSAFFFGALIIYSIFCNSTPKSGWNHQQIIYLFSMIGAGIIFAAVAFFFSRFAMWILTGLCFLCIAMYILAWRSGGLIHKRGGRIGLMVGLSVVGICLGLLVGRRLIIPCSAILGAYVTAIGLDLFARCGFIEGIAYFLKTDPTNVYMLTSNVSVMLGVGTGFAFFGMGFQFLCWRKHRRDLIAMGRTVHEFDDDWTVLGMKKRSVMPDPTYPAYPDNREPTPVITEKGTKKSWNPFKKNKGVEPAPVDTIPHA
ncbi:hypothetical protein BGZ76_001524 [Entomortierella beljakovae]|nr:hypothetical protein BGZ76_001524 [Entomortierella beljakovae]